jgi:hypothetical protein
VTILEKGGDLLGYLTSLEGERSQQALLARLAFGWQPWTKGRETELHTGEERETDRPLALWRGSK